MYTSFKSKVIEHANELIYWVIESIHELWVNHFN